MTEKTSEKKKTSKKKNEDVEQKTSSDAQDSRDGDLLPKPKVEVTYHVLDRKRPGDNEKPPSSPSAAFRRLSGR